MHAGKIDVPIVPSLNVVKTDEVNKNREELRRVRSIKMAQGLSPQVFYLIALAICLKSLRCSKDQLSS